MKRAIPIFVLACLALAAGRESRDVGQPVPNGIRPLDARHPALLAGRLERLTPGGAWLDLHAPLTGAEVAAEAALGYRRPAAFPIEPPLGPAPRAGAYFDLHGGGSGFTPRVR
jgi:hypothetical protein